MRGFGVLTVVTDPVLKKLENTSVCTFAGAENHYVGSGENRKQESHYFDFVLWDSGAESFHKNIKKLDKVYVECEPKQERWVTADGQKRSKIVFRVKSYVPVMTTPKSNNNSSDTEERGE